MYYLCEQYYKPITAQYYIADCISWTPRLTLLDKTTKELGKFVRMFVHPVTDKLDLQTM